MDDRPRCQSCGMPLSDEFKNLGTESDGSPVSEYCMFCYQNGGFTNPDQTVDGNGSKFDRFYDVEPRIF